MRVSRGRSGFTLLELIISLSLSTIVLIGVIVLATQLIRNEYTSVKQSEVSASTMASLDAMNRDLEQATYLKYPDAAHPSAISACRNYSATLSSMVPNPNGGQAGQIDPKEPIVGVYYCVVPGLGTQGNLDTLMRYPAWGKENACPANNTGPAECHCPYNNGTAPACTLADATSHDVVIYKNMAHSPVNGSYFRRDNTAGGIDMDFIVGYATAVATGQGTATAGQVALAQPVAYYVDSKITMSKAYLNSAD